MRRTSALVSLCMLAAAVISVGASSCDTETTSTPDSDQSDPAAKSQSGTAHVGDAMTLEGNDDGAQVKVRVLKVIDPLQGGAYDEPTAGARYVGIELAFVNTGSATYSDSPSNGAKIITGRDAQADPTLLTGGPCGDSFSSDVTIAPGGKRRGCIPFEVKGAQTLKTFQFALDSGFGPQTGEWALR